MDIRTWIRCLVKGVAPEALVRIDQLLHNKHRIGIPVIDGQNDIKFNDNQGTWTMSSRGATNTGTYIAGTDDFGHYTLYGKVCHCRFGINGSITGLDPGEINLISLPFPAILPWLNGNNVPLTIGTATNANAEYTVQLENTLPASWAILNPNSGDRTFDECGHFWYVANL